MAVMLKHNLRMLVLLSALTAGCSGSFPGPRYPPADPPLVEETPRTMDLTAACQE